MAVIPGYKPVSFQPSQLLDLTVLENLANNQQALLDYTPRAYYTYGSINRENGVKIMSGRALIAATAADHAHVTVRFNSFFSAGTNPNITTGIVSGSGRRFFVTTSGIGTLMPDNTGFNIYVYLDAQTVKKYDKIGSKIYIPWIAVGI